jgi:hypothetical protein
MSDVIARHDAILLEGIAAHGHRLLGLRRGRTRHL